MDTIEPITLMSAGFALHDKDSFGLAVIHTVTIELDDSRPVMTVKGFKDLDDLGDETTVQVTL